MEMHGKRILVAGATSAAGIRLCEAFLALGGEVWAAAPEKTRLHDLSAEIKTQHPSAVPIVAPLKGEARAAFKTLDKYGGDYRRLTDLARMCAALPAACFVPSLREK